MPERNLFRIARRVTKIFMCVCTRRDKKRLAASEKFSIEQNKTIHHLSLSVSLAVPPTHALFIKHQVLQYAENAQKTRRKYLECHSVESIKIIIIVSSARWTGFSIFFHPLLAGVAVIIHERRK
jgi:hypothetical protein